MPLFQKKPKENFSPEETPLGPRTYPAIGKKSGKFGSAGLTGSAGKSGKFNFLGALDKKKWWWIAGGLSLIVIIVLIVIFTQRAGRPGISDSVLVQIDGPERVALGSDISYSVNIINNSSDVLNENRLVVLYPDGFSYTKADPIADNAQGTEFSFDAIAPGQQETVVINGRLTGGVKTEQVLIARFQFLPEGGRELLQVEGTFTTSIETAAFSFDVNAPASILPNNSVTFSLDLENNEERPLDKLRIQAVYPGGFSFNKSEPNPTTDNNVWDKEQLGIGEKFEISIDGTLGGNIDEVKRFVFEAGFVDDDGSFLKQTEVEKTIKLTQPEITINQSVNGQQEILADSETSLLYAVEFSNTGPTGLSNLVLEVEFTDGVWDLSTLRAQNGGSIEDHVIRWDGVTVPALRTLESGQSSQVVFSVTPYRTVPVNNPADKHFSTVTKPRILIGSAKVDGNPVTTKYRADINVGATATAVSGPNPPEVGKETVFDITWTLGNGYNDLSGARLVGEVPAGATFVPNSGSVSVGEDLVFNSSKKQIVWNIGRVPANVGILQPVFTATFQVKITPQVNEKGQNKLLVTNQVFSAKDDWTSEQRKENIIDVETQKIP